MRTSRFRLLLSALCALAALALVPATASATSQSLCIGHHPQPYVWYTHSCTGHDEPELDPLSSAAGSAQDLTWTFVLPSNGTVPVDAVGPTFWIGGAVSDPNSLDGQAFLEVQFYPNSLLKGCASGGGYNVVVDPGVYTVCSPVWEVSPHGNAESAAFNSMLTNSRTGGPLIMHAGDTITDHQYITPAADGMHITITDVTTRQSGTIVLDSKVDGPLMPAFNVQKLGNSLGWGLVDDAPNAFVWEIGHTGNYTSPAGKLCDPGSATKPPCYSYNVPTWLQFSPIEIKSVTFGPTNTRPSGWATVSDLGGAAEVTADCGSYGGPFCTYPWYSYNSTYKAFTYGGDYPGTNGDDFGQASQFATTMQCDGGLQYCATQILNSSPVP